MKTLALFGGTGGLGTKLTPMLEEKYNVISLGSKDINITDLNEVLDFFNNNTVDIVVNMAGKKYDCYINDVWKDDYEETMRMVDINIKGNINLVMGCLPTMLEHGWGRIISISSIFSEMNVPKNSVYSASKAFIDRFILSVNRENAKNGVTCNTIQLGYWDGGMCYRVDKKIQEIAKDKIPLKRWGSIEELYNAINYIVENEYVSGTNLKLSGGL